MALESQEKRQLIESFARNTKDTGSTEVQIAILTEAIHRLTDHGRVYKKDLSGKRGLMQKVCQRKSLLSYLERTDNKKYKDVVKRLKLRK